MLTRSLQKLREMQKELESLGQELTDIRGTGVLEGFSRKKLGVLILGSLLPGSVDQVHGFGNSGCRRRLKRS